MKYILNQVYDKGHVLSQRIIGVCDTIEDANKKIKLRGFGELRQDENHSDAWKTDPMLYEHDGKLVGTTIIYAIEYNDVDSAAAESLLNPAQPAAQSALTEVTENISKPVDNGPYLSFGA